MTDELIEQRIATINAQKRYRDSLKMKVVLATCRQRSGTDYEVAPIRGRGRIS